MKGFNCFSCYRDITVGEVKRCGKCHKRVYCSKECQISDWKQAHKFWCCKAGELDHDFVIQDTGEGKGIGVFANRDFVAGEKVLADRCIMIPKRDKFIGERVRSVLTPLEVDAVMKLAPVGAQLEEILMKGEVSDPIVAKIARNSFGSTDEDHFITILGSRFNHACLGANNCYFQSDDDYSVLLFVASTPIKKGKEINLCYQDNTLFVKYSFPAKYGFNCECTHCRWPESAVLELRRTEIETTLERVPNMSVSDKLMCYQVLLVLYDALFIPELERESLYRKLFFVIYMAQLKSCNDLLYVLYSRYLYIMNTIYHRNTTNSDVIRSKLNDLSRAWPAGAQKYQNDEWASVNLFPLFPEPWDEQRVDKLIPCFDLNSITHTPSIFRDDINVKYIQK